jgi:hypothetical protein
MLVGPVGTMGKGGRIVETELDWGGGCKKNFLHYFCTVEDYDGNIGTVG